jgi:hypothetical protein
VIPDPDPIPLPAPAGLLTVLLVLTFTLHILAMNVTLGGAVIAVVSDFLGRRRGDERYRRLAQHLVSLLPITLAATITLGVAPLLFVQTLYGQFFYTSSILIAWPWLAVVPLVIVAYYGIYLYAWQGERLGDRRILVGAGSALLLIVVAFLYVNNITLMLTPDRWHEIYASHSNGLFLNGEEGTLVPRLFHFLVAAPAVAGAALMVYALFMKGRSPEGYWVWAARYGAVWFLVFTLVQAAIGPLFLFRLPSTVRDPFVGDDTLRTALLFVAIGSAVLGLLAMAAALRLRNPLPLGLVGGLSLIVTVSLMSVTRHFVRDEYLRPRFSTGDLAVDSQTVLIVLFFVALLTGVAVVAYMLQAILRASGPAQPEI